MKKFVFFKEKRFIRDFFLAFSTTMWTKVKQLDKWTAFRFLVIFDLNELGL